MEKCENLITSDKIHRLTETRPLNSVDSIFLRLPLLPLDGVHIWFMFQPLCKVWSKLKQINILANREQLPWWYINLAKYLHVPYIYIYMYRIFIYIIYVIHTCQHVEYIHVKLPKHQPHLIDSSHQMRQIADGCAKRSTCLRHLSRAEGTHRWHP